MTIVCYDCNMFWYPEDCELKMGGMLCPKCRIILAYPGSEPYEEAFIFNRLKRQEEEE